MRNLRQRVAGAVRHFWRTRDSQQKKQRLSGTQDQGRRGAATGGGQLDGFTDLIGELLIENGIPEGWIYRKQKVELPGFFRPTKKWDLLVVHDGNLLASIEFKSQVGPSFGNNYNNRAEEAVGNATDIWTAYREGVFGDSARPWLGYFVLLEDCARSTKAVSIREPHFQVFEEFRGTSYAERYDLTCRRLVRERLYDATCFLLSDRQGGFDGTYRELSKERGFERFAASLSIHVSGYLRML